ncbi:hypothetical protein PPERSA_03289 [Pseudocohnilembus persalinus]|uniref:Tetratricopeptide repeat protein n=1 Tax=Pseudocohnilembus persalinus TaxID=266149 RepID=A0A0V0Q8I0_PSEPJ|nr:hypothetical protein PPERSA_03289 [Pseudocohnilembus persalinus]|eukprot:KRW98458.1 hypothetical protein PPERSA_03289 [Pseudocohnilembus persalinus]
MESINQQEKNAKQFWCFICEEKFDKIIEQNENIKQEQYCEICNSPCEEITQQTIPQSFPIFTDKQYSNFDQMMEKQNEFANKGKQLFLSQNFADALRNYIKAFDCLYTYQQQKQDENDNNEIQVEIQDNNNNENPEDNNNEWEDEDDSSGDCEIIIEQEIDGEQDDDDEDVLLYDNLIKIKNNICLCQYKLNLFQDGEKSAKFVISLDQDNYKANYNRARCLIQLKKYTQAEKCLQICLKEKPNENTIHELINECKNTNEQVIEFEQKFNIGDQNLLKKQLSQLQDASQIVIENQSSVMIQIGEPILKQNFKFKIHSKQNGFSIEQLLRQLSKIFKKIYEEEFETATNNDKVYNNQNPTVRNETDGKYGIRKLYLKDIRLDKIIYNVEKNIHLINVL